MRISIALLISLFVLGCNSSPRSNERTGRSGKHYGGVFNANETEDLSGLFPLSVTQASSHRIASQIYEGLVRFDQRDLSILPCLAESWTMDPSGTIYTFTIREGVVFHNDPAFPDGKGRSLTARDVEYCLKAICTYSTENEMFWLFQDRVLGANAHYAASAKGSIDQEVEGIELIDERTVRVTLVSPWQSFLQVLAHQGCWIWPKEIIEHYGDDLIWHPIGTGPFQMKSLRLGEALIMERNPSYWRTDSVGDQLPFLDAIRYTFLQDKEKELEEVEKGHLSTIFEIPVGRTDILSRSSEKGYQVQSVPGLSVQFYGFNERMAPFRDVRVRKAFSMAIDRRWIVDSVLQGLAEQALHGIVPPGFASYPYDSVPVQEFDPEGARALLVEAGFPEGKGLPGVYLQVNNNGFGYVKVAGEVQTMLEKNLGARVITSVLPSEQHFDRVERGDAAMWREGWVADHPDPENFLALFYGKNAPLDSTLPATLNTTRYVNARFDSLYMHAQRTSDPADRMLSLALAERQLMKDAVVVPLYHEMSIRVLQPWVMDLPINGMEYRDLATVWMDDTKRPKH